MTGLRSLAGSLVPSQGLAMIFRSRTAERMIAETTLCSTEIVSGASAFRFALWSEVLRRRTQAWTSDGRIVDSCRSPNVG